MALPQTIFITRDCLNAGITEDVALFPTFSNDKWAQTKDSIYFSGEWHLTRPEAVAKAERMRLDEIDRLEKRLAQLKAMRFK